MSRNSKLRAFSAVLAIAMLLCLAAGCGGTTYNPKATITFEDGSEIVVTLYPSYAPNTVANFIYLANSGFYDGTIIHRVVDDFIIQGGDPEGTGLGGPGYTIDGEFSANGYNKNDLSHVRGTISMARFSDEAGTAESEEAFNSAGSQFFICVEDDTDLDGQYAAFGKIFTGYDVLDEISSVKTDSSDKPKTDIVIKSIVVETYDTEYKQPKTNKIAE